MIFCVVVNTNTHTEQRPTTDLLFLALAPVFHNNTSTTTSATNVRTQSDLLGGWVVRAPLLGPLQALLCLHLITLLFLFKAAPPSIVLTHSLILFLDNLIVLSFIFTHALVVVSTPTTEVSLAIDYYSLAGGLHHRVKGCELAVVVVPRKDFMLPASATATTAALMLVLMDRDAAPDDDDNSPRIRGSATNESKSASCCECSQCNIIAAPSTRPASCGGSI